MTDGFKLLTENDTCSVCGCAVQIVIEKTGRGTKVRHSNIYDVHEDPDAPDGIARYYLHFNARP
jgi:hypothetical protein